MKYFLLLISISFNSCLGQYPNLKINQRGKVYNANFDSTKYYYTLYVKYQHLWDRATKDFDYRPTNKALKEVMRYQDSCVRYTKLLKRKKS